MNRIVLYCIGTGKKRLCRIVFHAGMSGFNSIGDILDKVHNTLTIFTEYQIMQDTLGDVIILVPCGRCHLGRNQAHSFFHIIFILADYPYIANSCHYR